MIREEYKKCALSAEYFLRRYCYVQHPVRGKMLFDLYGYQKDALQHFEEHDYNIILKGRQLGFSTLIAGYSLWLMLFGSDRNILVIATKQEVAKNLITKVRYMHDSLPVWLRGEDIENNKLTMRLTNGSQIKAVASSKDAGRSEALSLLILDEAAFIDDAEIIWTAAQATLSTGGRAILNSTPNGVGNFFHRMWQQAENGENEFNPILLDWRVHPDRDQAWRDRQTELLGVMQSAQEHDASFIFSGNTVINAEIIEFYKETYMQEPIAKQGFDNNLWIWEYPDPNKSYIVCADVARGDGMDTSTLHVIDIDSSTQVAEYKGKIPTKEFGDLLVSVATQYNDAILIPENNNIGWNAIQRVIDRDYKNLFYMSNDLQYIDVESQITDRRILNERNMKPGFTTSRRTRPLIIARLEEYMRENSITIRSSRMVAELETFIWKNGRPEALEGYNDDLVMALAIGLWVRDTALRLKQEGIDLTKRTLEYMDASATPMITSNNSPRHNPYEFHISKDEVEDLRWLLG